MLSGPPATAGATPAQLLSRFLGGNSRQRRSLLPQLEQCAEELRPLVMDQLNALDATGDDWAAGWLIQLLLGGPEVDRQRFASRYPEGWLVTTSAQGVSYSPLQSALAQQSFEEADRLTSALLRELAGRGAVQRGYVYYSEVPAIAAVDLESLDRLWVCYSQGRFGFSVQGRLLLACGGRWELLWPRLHWKAEGVWSRYPGGFQWSITAPEGHMPLVNQLRGVRLMDALLQHPAVQQRVKA